MRQKLRRRPKSPRGRERYGVYSTDAERRQKTDGPADRTDGCECCPEGRGHALDVHFG